MFNQHSQMLVCPLLDQTTLCELLLMYKTHIMVFISDRDHYSSRKLKAHSHGGSALYGVQSSQFILLVLALGCMHAAYVSQRIFISFKDSTVQLNLAGRYMALDVQGLLQEQCNRCVGPYSKSIQLMCIYSLMQAACNSRLAQ